MFVERHVWQQHPWSSYAVFLTTLARWAPLWDTGLWLYRPEGRANFWLLLSIMVFSKVIKLIPIIFREPLGIVWLLVSILFGQTLISNRLRGKAVRVQMKMMTIV